MTTDAVSVLRESVDDWPSLTAAGLTGEQAVLSFVIEGGAHDDAVDRAARSFCTALRAVGAAPSGLAVVTRVGNVDASRPLNRHRLRQEGPWWLAGGDPFASVEGERHVATRADAGDGLVDVFEALEVGVDEVPAVLVAARTLDAVLVGWRGAEDATGVLGGLASRGSGVFEAAAALLPSGLALVVRSFGAFLVR